MPFRARKKSKCHQERRNSPSVASFRPTSACFLMIFAISRSPTALSAAESISPLANLARASFSGAVRSRLPTMSARNGGVVRWVIGDSLPDYRPRIANSEWRIGGDPPIPFATRYSLLATRYSLLATRYSLLATRYSLLATRYSLLAIRSSAPNLVGELNNHPQLGPLLFLGQHVAFFGGGEAALRRQAQLIERDIFGCLLDALLDVVARLQPAGLRGDQTEHDDLVAFRLETQRLETTGALAVVFQEVAVVVAFFEQGLRHRLVAARRNPGRAEIAAANVRGNGHVGGLGRQRLVGAGRVGLLQMIDVETAVLGLLHLLLRAQIRPGNVVELQIAAAGVVESLDRLLIGDCKIVEDGVAARVILLGYSAWFNPEMHHARRRDCHLWHHLGVGLQKLEVLQHRVIGEADFALDPDALHLGLHAMELDAVIELIELDAVEHAEKIEVPPGAAEFAVSGELEPDLLLLLDDLLDLAVLDRLELGRVDLALLALRARLFDRRGA